MRRKYYSIQQILSMLPVLAVGRLLSASGRSSQAMRLMSRHVNSHWWKKSSFAGYTATANDVFIATFAKSGTNWMMQIAQQIAYLGTAEFEHIHDLVAWPDAPFPEVRARLNDPTLARRSPSGLRIIKTHFEPNYVSFNKQAKYIVVIRDPKEVIVSGYYFAGAAFNVLRVEYDLEQWLASAMQPDTFLFGDWAAHTASWWAVRDQPNVLVMTFDELKKNTADIIGQVAELMNVQLRPEQADSVAERSTFAWMKAHESQFKPPSLPQPKGKERPLMMRSGKAGKSAELLTAEQRSDIDAFFSDGLKGLGSDFPYDQFSGKK
jgi:hypothetical protein